MATGENTTGERMTLQIVSLIVFLVLFFQIIIGFNIMVGRYLPIFALR